MPSVIITYKRPRGNEQHSPALSTYTLTPQDMPGEPWTGGYPGAMVRLMTATGVDKLGAQDALMNAWTQGRAEVPVRA